MPPRREFVEIFKSSLPASVKAKITEEEILQLALDARDQAIESEVEKTVALALAVSEVEKKLAVSEVEKTSAVALAVSEVEKKLAVAQSKTEGEIMRLSSFYKRQLSFLLQR